MPTRPANGAVSFFWVMIARIRSAVAAAESRAASAASKFALAVTPR